MTLTLQDYRIPLLLSLVLHALFLVWLNVLRLPPPQPLQTGDVKTVVHIQQQKKTLVKKPQLPAPPPLKEVIPPPKAIKPPKVVTPPPPRKVFTPRPEKIIAVTPPKQVIAPPPVQPHHQFSIPAPVAPQSVQHPRPGPARKKMGLSAPGEEDSSPNYTPGPARKSTGGIVPGAEPGDATAREATINSEHGGLSTGIHQRSGGLGNGEGEGYGEGGGGGPGGSGSGGRAPGVTRAAGKRQQGNLPIYTKEMQDAQVSGTVTLAVSVGDHNNFKSASVIVTSKHAELDEAARAALSTWKWASALKDGQPIPGVVTVIVTYNYHNYPNVVTCRVK